MINKYIFLDADSVQRRYKFLPFKDWCFMSTSLLKHTVQSLQSVIEVGASEVDVRAALCHKQGYSGKYFTLCLDF